MPKYLPVYAEIAVQGDTIPYEWSRKAVKNFNLRVRPDGSVAVSSPTRVTQEQIEAFLRAHLDFIRKARAKMAAHHPAKVCLLEAGDTLPIFGKTHTVCLLNAKKYEAYAQNGMLYLCLLHPEDVAARVRLFWRFAAKEVEREMGDPEGNLVIVERVAHECQRLFSCREYGWVGTAHVLTSTQDGT